MRALKTCLGLMTLILFGCVSTQSVMYDYDLSVDFDSYSTYVLCSDDMMVIHLDHPKIDNEEIRQLLGDAIGNAMEARGHQTNVFEPQLQAGFRIAINEETAKFNNCEHSDELEYWESCEIHKETYDQETLITYVANFKTNTVLWQVSMPCDLKKNKAQLKNYTADLINQLFETYPKSQVVQ